MTDIEHNGGAVTPLTNISGQISGSTINIAGGDFVGADRSVITGNIYGNITIDRPREKEIELISGEIDNIRGRVTRLIPAEEAIISLERLREPETIEEGWKWSVSPSFSLFGMSIAKYEIKGGINKAKNGRNWDDSTSFLQHLSGLQAKISHNLSEEELLDLKQKLSNIADEVGIKISRLHMVFKALVHPALTTATSINNLVSKIGHKELKEEAQMHHEVAESLVKLLDVNRLLDDKLDVIGDTSMSSVGVMTELEKHRHVVERLVKKDRSMRNRTIGFVTFYIALSIATAVLVIIYEGNLLVVDKMSLNQLKLPLLGIPWPVIVWSLIGSFAAMIYRFNKRPIYDFGDAVKWMLTRPVQGVVLGSAFYLVLVSGLFLLTGRGENVSSSSTTVLADEVVLILSFLVGFSDRFADSVFNTLVDRYTVIKEKQDGDGTKIIKDS